MSTFRAISVWNFWNDSTKQGSRLDELHNHLGKKLFSVSGYAETRPVPCSNFDPNVTNPSICPDGKIDDIVSQQKNRRIDIRFTVRRPALEDYQAINSTLE